MPWNPPVMHWGERGSGCPQASTTDITHFYLLRHTLIVYQAFNLRSYCAACIVLHINILSSKKKKKKITEISSSFKKNHHTNTVDKMGGGCFVFWYFDTILMSELNCWSWKVYFIRFKCVIILLDCANRMPKDVTITISSHQVILKLLLYSK